MKKDTGIVSGLSSFIRASPTPWHAATNISSVLLENGFEAVTVEEVAQGGAIASNWFTQTEGTIFAFHGTDSSNLNRLRIVGAHTDSPCLRIKQVPDKIDDATLRLAVEVYGGALLYPWFDRPLGIAGKVTYRQRPSAKNTNGSPGGEAQTILIDIKKHRTIIPSLAIHLDRDANSGHKINPEIELNALFGQVSEAPQSKLKQGEHPTSFNEFLVGYLAAEHGLKGAEILSHQLCLYPALKIESVGVESQWLAAPRLDNLLSCYVGLQAFLDSSEPGSVLVCHDHEEIGSQSAVGAASPLVDDLINAISTKFMISPFALRNNSAFLSFDNAHAFHPNYPEKHDANHRPTLGGGVVIKYNANNRYATDSAMSGRFKALCQDAEIPTQDFVMRSDMACGSTIGPISASRLGMPVMDAGIAQLAMHSPLELCGVSDIDLAYKALKVFYGQF